MLSFIVFAVVALISIIILLSLSIRHGINNLSAWFGALFIFLGTILKLSAESEPLATASYIIFGLGNALLLWGIYALAERFIRKTASKSPDMQAKTISDILEVAASRESLIELLNYSLDRFLEIFSLNSGAIHIFHRAKNRLVMGSFRGLIPAHAKKLELLEPGETAIGRAVQNKRVLIIRDLSVSPDYQFFGGRGEGYSFLAVAPILVDEKCWGVITLLGRQKYHRGMFTIDQLEQFGQKLGQALVLGRENRRMAAAFKHISDIVELYGRVFNYIRKTASADIVWNDVSLFKSLNIYKSDIFDGKSFAVMKFTADYAQTVYLKDSYDSVPNGTNDLSKLIPAGEAALRQKAPDYFLIDKSDLGKLLPIEALKNKKLAGYGYPYDKDYYALCVVDDCDLTQLKNYDEDLGIIGNLLTISFARQSHDKSGTGKMFIEEKLISKAASDLTTLLGGISGSAQMITERIGQDSDQIEGEELYDWLDNIEKSAYQGINLINQLGLSSDPNKLIQTVIERRDLNVAFYPGTRLPVMKSSSDDFMRTIDAIITEAVAGNKPIRLKSSPQNNSIALTIEGQVGQDFPSRGILDRIGRHNIILNVVRDVKDEKPDIQAKTDSVDSLNALTIEDKPVIIDLLEDFFGKLGHNNITLTSGEKGLAYIKNAGRKNEHIDVVVIGLTLEDMSGLELCRQIKEIDSSIFAIIISSWGVNLHTHTLKDAGVDAVLHKPFRLEQFKNVLPGKELKDAPGH